MQAFLKGGASSSKGASTSKAQLQKQEEALASKPWVEKYRPKCVDDVAHQDEVVAVLRKSLTGADLPNLLFYGPPGTGKTSTILALSRELFGFQLMKERVLELNSSDERGINVIREKVKNFAQLTANSLREDGKKCPPYKIIILDEADSMTKAAQEALRRTMEKSSKTTRFCLICNYVTRIIPPIISRCSQFRFKSLSTEDQKKRLWMVCEKEGVKISQDAMSCLVKCSEGDLRKAMTYLQTAHRLKGAEGIDEKDVLEITGVVPDDIIKSLIRSCASNSHDKVQESVDYIISEGHSAAKIISQLHDEVLTLSSLNDLQKSVVMEKIAIVDKCLSDGADEYLQLMALATTLQRQIAL
uniref:replication factor C subunit 4-like n=1 Tax=Ciona intestinalis TaxID=7719 RepID=UPI000180C833|nr:replication factor C subunit 4-like [Ciona intestinalis]|eukprot:XP_002129985.1 replication factor C subunit 4-like [Ciona intestinalis]